MEKMVNDVETKMERELKGIALKIFTIVAVFGSLYTVYALGIVATSAVVLRVVHLTVAAVLIFLLHKFSKKGSNEKVNVLDIALIIGILTSSVYVLTQGHAFHLRSGFTPTELDVILGAITVLIILEMVRRTLGLPLLILTVFLMLYAYFGRYFPGILQHRGSSLEKIISHAYSLEGIYGIPLAASSTFVVLFILFGAFLRKTGTGDLYTDVAYGLAGRTRGGPAKVAVIASALFGTISGSGIANVVTTGTLSIPLMKKTGFTSRFAAAVESVASTGGQMMPPIMGVGAFLMAEMTNIPYYEIVIAATIPAMMYFFAIFLMIDFEGGKKGLKGLSAKELPNVKEVLKNRGHLFIPLIVLLFTLLVLKTTAMKAAFIAILATIIVSFFKETTRLSFASFIEALEDGYKSALSVISACAAAGIIVAMISLTGVGIKLSSLILGLAGNSLFLALVLTALIVIIMSMGLPTVAAYIITAAVVAPGLVEIGGISTLQAHLFIFYFACLSGITPPVALVAYPAAAIAKADPVEVSLTAFKLGLVGFLVPFMFIYTPGLLMAGSSLTIVSAIITSIIGVYALTAGLQGWLQDSKVVIYLRPLLFISGILLMIAELNTDVAGIALFILCYFIHVFLKRKESEPKNESYGS